ncbi:hypothetical protein AMTRI_Chr02g212690 [Amborella trichopoda]
MSQRDSVTWNSMITCYCQNGIMDQAGLLFDAMTKRNVVSWSTMMTRYSHNQMLEEARRLFDRMPNTNLELFDLMPKRNWVSWVVLISGYLQVDEFARALLVFLQMRRAGILVSQSGIAMPIIASFGLDNMYLACKIYENAPEQTLSTHIAMITEFAQNGRILEAREVFNGIQNQIMLEEARALFDTMPDKNSVTWAAMVSGYAQHEKWEQALIVFSELHKERIVPKYWTYTTQIHSLSIKTGCQFNPFVSNGLITMYAKCKHIEDASWQFGSITVKDKIQWSSLVSKFSQNQAPEEACHVFDTMGNHDIISWTSMISVDVQAGHACQVNELFTTMSHEGLKPNPFTVTSILCICADLTMLFDLSAMMSTYFKCDSTANAFRLLNMMHRRDLITWNMFLDGCARYGLGIEAVRAYEEMIAEGVAPDQSTFMGLLCACSHECMIEEGCRYFDSMSKDHRLMPHDGHYACMVGLLGQFGQLFEAEKFIRNMLIAPDLEVWEALLGVVKLTLISNWVIELQRCMWTMVKELRKMMNELGAMRKSGCCSWIHVKNMVNWFFIGDERHEEREETYWSLGELYEHLRSSDYMLETEFVMDVLEEEDFIGERLPWLLTSTDIARGAIQSGQRL